MPTPRRRYRYKTYTPSDRNKPQGRAYPKGSRERVMAERNGVRFGPDDRPIQNEAAFDPNSQIQRNMTQEGGTPYGQGPGGEWALDEGSGGDAQAQLQTELETRLGPDVVAALRSKDPRVVENALRQSGKAGLFLRYRYSPTDSRFNSKAGAKQFVGDQYKLYNEAADYADGLDNEDAARAGEADAAKREADAIAAEEQGRTEVRTQIQAFINSLDIPDPRISELIQSRAINAAQKFAGQSGQAGASGLGARSAAGMAAKAENETALARQQMKVPALGLLQNNQATTDQLKFGYAGLNQSAEQFNINRQDQIDAQKWAADQNTGQAIGSIIGGGLGALGYIGGPAVGAATMAAGSSIGGGIGGLAAGGSSGPSYSARPLRARPQRTQGGGGGLGGGPF